MSKIMRVYYDNAGHPYKDSSLSTLYPIVGNEFTGANNTSEIHFYTDNLGIATWIANCKLPNGTLVNRLLVPGIDAEGDQYFNLPLDSELTSVVGHLKIGLNGYAGNISIDEEELENNDLVVISGTPTIVATGIIDIAMNYSPITIPISSLTPNEYQELLAIIGSKLDTIKGIVVVDNIIGVDPTTYTNDQIIYDKESHLFYRVVSGEFVVEPLDIGELEINGERLADILNDKVDKTTLPNRIYGTDNNGNQKVYNIDEIGEEIANVPKKQMTTSIIKNLQENVSGRPLTNYTFTLNEGVNYSWYHALYNGEEVTEEKARDYMEYMTGSRFLPGFDYDHPQNSYFIAADGKVYKPQFVNNSFDLYVMPIPFENTANKVNSISIASTDVQYPTAKCVWDNLQNVREVAEGKCETWILSYSDTMAIVKSAVTPTPPHYSPMPASVYTYNSSGEIINITQDVITGAYDDVAIQNSLFNSNNSVVSNVYGYIITKGHPLLNSVPGYENQTIYFLLPMPLTNLDEMHRGDIFLVIETDVPDRWYDGGTTPANFYKMETSKVDLANYYTKNASLIPITTNTYDIGSATATYKDLHLSDGIYLYGSGRTFKIGTGNGYYLNISIGGTDAIVLNDDAFSTPNGKNLGSSTQKWNNIWFSGNLKGGATLTQAQYDALVSGGTVDADTFYFIEEE